MSNDRPLTAKQLRFVDEYLIDLNATQAAIRAGYSEKTARVQGSRLMAHAGIAAEVQKAMDQRSEVVRRCAADVVRDLQAVKDDAMQMVTDRDGNSVMADRGAAIRALELEGKHYRMFSDKLEQGGANGSGVPLDLRVEFVGLKQAAVGKDD